MSGIKLVSMIFIGFLLIMVGVTGKLGSFLASVIDPASLQEGQQQQNSSSLFSFQTGGSSPPQSPNGTLSPQQIGFYASRAGFTGQNLVIAIAVALAESGGSVGAINTANKDGSTDRGLWQINSVHKQFQQSRLFDPAYNAFAAFQISGGHNWFPWATYTTTDPRRSYTRFLNDAQKAVQGVRV